MSVTTMLLLNDLADHKFICVSTLKKNNETLFLHVFGDTKDVYDTHRILSRAFHRHGSGDVLKSFIAQQELNDGIHIRTALVPMLN